MNIITADDHALLRHGVRRLLEAELDWTVVGEARTGLEAVQLATED